ncbi:MAG: hypothetical protein II769_06790 [Oscillospiraceae bacterium]|nr:hypothetical protein [Oscillospiraceae bacterium]
MASLITGACAPKLPVTREDDTVDVYFGTEVADPYRWLEDDNSAETAEWVKAQNKVTDHYLKGIPFRGKVLERLMVWPFSTISDFQEPFVVPQSSSRMMTSWETSTRRRVR